LFGGYTNGVYITTMGQVRSGNCLTSPFFGGYTNGVYITTIELLCYTVRPMSRMRLTSLQKSNRARWQMLFHPTVLKFGFCDPLAFGQMCISCASWAFTGCNVTHSSISSRLVQRDPPHPLHLSFFSLYLYCELLGSARYFYGLNTYSAILLRYRAVAKLFDLFLKLCTNAPQRNTD
jgi:hypothetical protein